MNILLIFLLSTGAGRQFYVAPGGSNSADGTALHPWATIQKAANTVAAGDTVHVAPGTYTTSAKGIRSNTSGSAGAPITFISDVKWGAVLYNPGGVNSEQVWDNRGDYVIIENFDMSGDGTNGVWCGIANTGSYCQFIGNRVHDIKVPGSLTRGGAGIDTWQVDSLGGHNTIVGNVVFGIGTPGEGKYWHGIYETAPYAYIANNMCYGNQYSGITNGHYSHDQIIINNLIFANGGEGIYLGGAGPVTTDNDMVINNIIFNNGGYATFEGSYVGTHEQYINNCVYGNARGEIIQGSGHVYSPVGTVSASPQFVNYKSDGTGDYHLAAGSPCINAGSTRNAPSTDMDGVARRQGAGVDIGSYEWVSPRPVPGGIPDQRPTFFPQAIVP